MQQKDNNQFNPQASRPDIPEYGLLDADQGRGLLPWRWAEERLEKSRNYWIATMRPDGRPHATAVWIYYPLDYFGKIDNGNFPP